MIMEKIPPSRQTLVPYFIRNAKTSVIARDTGYSENTVCRWRKEFLRTGSVADKQGRGRRKLLTPADTAWLIRTSDRHPKWSSKLLCVKLHDARGVDVCASGIRKQLQAANRRAHRQPRKPALTSAQKDIRLQFAKAHQDTDWNVWLFSDETGVALEQTRGYVRGPPGKICGATRVAHPQHTNLWVGMTAKGLTSYHIYRENLTVDLYREILSTHLLQSAKRLFRGADRGRWVFQQDNHPTHTSKAVTTWLDEHGVRRETWPGSSPDLSPIENFFRSLKHQAMARDPRSLDELEDVLRELLDDDSWVSTEKYISSMPERMRAVIQAKGGVIKY